MPSPTRLIVLIAVSIALRPAAAGAEDAYRCLVRPHATVEIAAADEGLLASVEVERGDRVRRGQVIARLESSGEERDVALAQERAASDVDEHIALARQVMLARRLERTDRLSRSAIVSDAVSEEIASEAAVAELEVRRARWQRRLAELELDRAEAALERRIVRSPVDGVVTARAMEPGEYRSDRAAVVTVAELDPLRVEANLPVGLYDRIRVGMPARVQLEDPFGDVHAATVGAVDAVFDTASRTFGVVLDLPNPAGAIPAGMHCSLTFGAAQEG